GSGQQSHSHVYRCLPRPRTVLAPRVPLFGWPTRNLMGWGYLSGVVIVASLRYSYIAPLFHKPFPRMYLVKIRRATTRVATPASRPILRSVSSMASARVPLAHKLLQHLVNARMRAVEAQIFSPRRVGL